jgi:hypothetical protein
VSSSQTDRTHPYPDRHAIAEADDGVRVFMCDTSHEHHYAADFGQRMRMQAVTLYASKPYGDWMVFLRDLVRALGMRQAHEPVVFNYPGIGWTIVQPIIESAIVLDLWDKHKAGYLMIMSCGGFRPDVVIKTANDHGIVAGFPVMGELRID